MAHRFRRSETDPYAAALGQVEENVYPSGGGFAAGADANLPETLADAIVTSLGDIAAQAFRFGVSDPAQLDGLAEAIRASASTVLRTYEGEVDPEPAISAIEQDGRLASLPDEAQLKLRREAERTRQLERLLLEAKRLPELMKLAGQLGLTPHENAIDRAELLLSRHPTPTVRT